MAIARMRRALYEYGITGIKSNILFHRAVMENQRFIQGNLGTQFIDSEASLIDDMKRIAGEGLTLQEKLPHRLPEKKKIAAIAATATENDYLFGIEEYRGYNLDWLIPLGLAALTALIPPNNPKSAIQIGGSHER